MACIGSVLKSSCGLVLKDDKTSGRAKVWEIDMASRGFQSGGSHRDDGGQNTDLSTQYPSPSVLAFHYC